MRVGEWYHRRVPKARRRTYAAHTHTERLRCQVARAALLSAGALAPTPPVAVCAANAERKSDAWVLGKVVAHVEALHIVCCHGRIRVGRGAAGEEKDTARRSARRR